MRTVRRAGGDPDGRRSRPCGLAFAPGAPLAQLHELIQALSAVTDVPSDGISVDAAFVRMRSQALRTSTMLRCYAIRTGTANELGRCDAAGQGGDSSR